MIRLEVNERKEIIKEKVILFKKLVVKLLESFLKQIYFIVFLYNAPYTKKKKITRDFHIYFKFSNEVSHLKNLGVKHF